MSVCLSVCVWVRKYRGLAYVFIYLVQIGGFLEILFWIHWHAFYYRRSVDLYGSKLLISRGALNIIVVDDSTYIIFFHLMKPLSMSKP